MTIWFDRDGKPLDMAACEALFKDPEYKKVGLDYVHGHRVSTVWLGVIHDRDDQGRPLIFETMVFKGEDFSDVDGERYATLEQAKAGHLRYVEMWKNGAPVTP